MKVLSSGIDTLILAFDVLWRDDRLFKNLRDMKVIAKEEDKDRPGRMFMNGGKDEWIFNLRPFGARGYEWILTSRDFNLRIGNWLRPNSRPNVMVEIGSESCWKNGPLNIVERIQMLIEDNGGTIIQNKVSRADLCVDILLGKKIWNEKIDRYIVTKAKKWNMRKSHIGVEGLEVGTGTIRARLYDKPLEIKQKSKKNWMYDIWHMGEPEEGKYIVRVEFQIRREVIKELGAGDTVEFFQKCDEVWAYCTKTWLKFRTRPGENANLRKTFPWWKEVQNGFYGIQGASPAIREKAFKEDADQLRAQIVGCACSLAAIDLEKRGSDIFHEVGFKDYEKAVTRKITNEKDVLEKIKENVVRKRAKY